MGRLCNSSHLAETKPTPVAVYPLAQAVSGLLGVNRFMAAGRQLFYAGLTTGAKPTIVEGMEADE